MGKESKAPPDAHCPNRSPDGAIPPKLYGGTERVVYWLVEELVALGHDLRDSQNGKCSAASAARF
jgi:hypothetical protein